MFELPLPLSSVTSFLHKLYLKRWIRFPIKYLFMLGLYKVFHDAYMLLCWGFPVSASNVGRHSFIQGAHSPLNPTFPAPYPYYSTYQQYKDILAYRKLTNHMVRLFFPGTPQRYAFYTYHGFRQDESYLQHLLLYTQRYRYDEMIKYGILNKMKNEFGAIPTGAFQSIRKLQQTSLDSHKPITPDL